MTKIYSSSNRIGRDLAGLSLRGLILFSFVVSQTPLGSFFATHAQTTTFEIGKIPEQPAFYGNTLAFSIRASSVGTGVSYSMSPQPQPKGAITLNTATGDFSYAPVPEDRGRFVVTFRALGASGTVQQQVGITPQNRQEYSLINNTRDIPDPASKDYVRITIKQNSDGELFNASLTRRPRRSITISGKIVILQANSGISDIYDTFNGNPDIREMSIHAEKLIVRNAFMLPQTNVTIYARDLVFEDQAGAAPASINTTPLSNWPDAQNADDSHEAGNGVSGNKGGNISVFANNFSSTSSSPVLQRFVLLGGQGQRAGIGRRGVPGDSMPSQSFRGDDGRNWGGVVYVQAGDSPGRGIYGTPSWPTNGIPPKKAGNPGNGGDGGNFTTNLSELQNSIGQDGGEPAPVGISYVGGAAGQPIKSVWLKIRNDYCTEWGMCSKGDREWRCCKKNNGTRYEHYRPDPSGSGNYHTSTGYSATLVPTTGKKGSPGTFVVVNEVSGKLSWLHPEFLQSIIDHAKDVYLNGHLEDTRVVLQKYNELLADAPEGTFPPDLKLRLDHQGLEIESMLHRLSSNLDYFGNPAGYVPLLSLQTNLHAYKNEIDSANSLLYMTYWLGKKADNLEAKKQALNEGKQRLQVSTATAIQEFNSKQSEIGELQLQATLITAKMTKLQTKLVEKEKQLMQRADADVNERHKVPFWKTSLRVIGAVSKVVPLYQPALGAVGSGLEVISNIDTNSSIDTIEQLGNVANEIDKAKLDASSAQLRQQLADVNPNNAAGAKDYVKKIAPLAKKIAETQRAVRQATMKTQAPQSEIEAELMRIKSEDSEFNDLINEVEELNIEKELFSAKAAQNIQRISVLANEISANLLAIDSMNADLASASASLSPETKTYLKEVERSAKERLLKYNYYMAKAYEYRMVRAYPGSLRLDTQFDNLLLLATADSNFKSLNEPTHPVTLSAAEFDKLRGVYEAPLRNIVSEILAHYNRVRPERSDAFDYTLTKKELDDLNKRNSLSINLDRVGGILPNEENQRLVGITTDIDARLVNPSARHIDNASVKLTYQLPRRSLIREGYRTYVFNFPTETVWQTSYDAVTKGKPTETKLSVDTESLLRSLLGSAASDDENILLFVRPSLLGDLKVGKSIRFPSQDISVEITKLKLHFTYEYYPILDELSATLNVQVPRGLAPHIRVSLADQVGLKDGKGDFMRVYAKPSSVVLEAHPTGKYVFKEWYEGGRWSGDRVENGTRRGTNASLTVTMDSSKVFRAVYVLKP